MFLISSLVWAASEEEKTPPASDIQDSGAGELRWGNSLQQTIKEDMEGKSKLETLEVFSWKSDSDHPEETICVTVKTGQTLCSGEWLPEQRLIFTRKNDPISTPIAEYVTDDVYKGNYPPCILGGDLLTLWVGATCLHHVVFRYHKGAISIVWGDGSKSELEFYTGDNAETVLITNYDGYMSYSPEPGAKIYPPKTGRAWLWRRDHPYYELGSVPWKGRCAAIEKKLQEYRKNDKNPKDTTLNPDN